MSSHEARPLLILIYFVFLVGAFASGVAQELNQAHPPNANSNSKTRSADRITRRDPPQHNWTARGRSAPGQSPATLRFRAYQQKMAFRSKRAAAKIGSPASVSTSWASVGPAPLASDATGDGGQDYNWVSGRATSVLIDPADPSGNTVLLGGAYGGLWKSTNAGSQSSSPAAVTWQSLIDDQPTLAVGAIALQPGNSNLILVGTGETNNSADSYYGLGILRSTDGGVTWGTITGVGQPADNTFLGIGFSKIAFSTANPSLVVAATAGDNGLCLGEEEAPAGGGSPCLGPEEDGNSPARGLYFSQDAGATWNQVILSDSAVPASATSVIYNASQGASGTFYAFIRRHGLYSSTDGQHFTRLATQPSAGLASALCPPTSNATSCQIYRGEFAVVPGRNEMYAWVVDVQPDMFGNPTPADEGIWQSLNGGATWTQVLDNGITNCGDDAFGPNNSGCGVEQGWYNLELAAIPNPPPPNSTGTDLYAGAVNLYKCTLEPGSTTCTQGDWINLTHVYGCDPLAAPAHVFPNQHGIAFTAVSANTTSPGYFAHDGGISRTLDGYSGLTTGVCSGTNQFDSLSQTLGSMTEFVSISTHPTNAAILLGGAENNASPKTSTATTSTTFQNALGGAGTFTAINPTNPNEWFAENPYVTILACEAGTACNDSGFVEVVNEASLGGDEGAYNTPYILDPQNSAEMLVGTCRVWQITTSGTSPLQLSNDFDTLGTGLCTGKEINLATALAAAGPTNSSGYSQVVYAVTNGFGPLTGSPGGEVWVTTNAGVSLMTNVTQNEAQNINPNGYAISSVALDSSDPTGNTAYVGIMGFSTPGFPTSHVWQTTNAGASWTDWTGTGLPDSPVNALLVDSSAAQVYVGTDVGVFVSPTSAPNWTEVGPAPGPGVSGFLPNAPVTALQLFNSGGTKTLVASTYGRGLWNYALPTSAGFTNVISNSPQTVFPTQIATFNGTLTAQNGYNSKVNLSCAGAPPPACTINPTSETPTASYLLTTGGNTVAGNYTFNAQAVGTDPLSITVNEPVTLQVVDFNLTAPSPNSLTVGQGGTSPASTFQVTAAGSFAGSVALSCPTGLPTGAACLFSPSSSVNPTSTSPVTVTLTVTAAVGTPAVGPVTVTIAAVTAGAPAAKTQTFSLLVTKATPDFAIAVAATPNTTVANQNVTWNGTLTALNGYNGSVILSCTAGAPGTCAISPPTLSPTTTGAQFTVTLGSAVASAVAFSFTIQGTDGTLTHATPTETLTVGTDVAWTNTGSASIKVLAGQSASFTFTATPVGNASFSSAVTLQCVNLPVMTACQFNPTAIAAGAQTTTVGLTITTIGPNFGTESQTAPRTATKKSYRTNFERHRGLPLLALASVFAVGIVLSSRKKAGCPILNFALFAKFRVGISRRRSSRTGRKKASQHFWLSILLGCLALGLMAEISCGGLGSGSTTPPPITVTVNPTSGTVLFAAEPDNSWPASVTQQQFTATVNGSSNQNVTWAVTGGDANGTVDGTGLYSSPAAVPAPPNPATIAVTAASSFAQSPGTGFVNLVAATPLGTSQITVAATAVGGTAHGSVVTLTVQ